MKKIFLIIAITTSLFLTACVNGAGSKLQSFTNSNFPINLNYQIATDITNQLKAVYPAGQTSFHLITDNYLHTELEHQLRLQGFTIVAENSDNALTLAWTVDILEGSPENSWYLTVKVSDGYTFSKIYSLNNEKLNDNGKLSQIII